MLELKNAGFEKNPDEQDSRDWEAVWSTMTLEEAVKEFNIPVEFIVDNDDYKTQDIKGYEMSCWSQWTINAINCAKKIKHDKPFLDQNKFRDYMKEIWLTIWVDGSWWSYVEDNVKQAYKKGYISMFYKVNSILTMVLALYKTDMIVTGSNKINWAIANTTWEVRNVTKWVGHCICINGFNLEKKIWNYNGAFRFKNSYWKDFWDNGGWWIPFDIALDVLFNYKCAMVVTPEWSKLPLEERYKIFLETRQN